MTSTLFPVPIDYFRDSRNGHQPSSQFYLRGALAENWLTAHGTHREVFNRAWPLGQFYGAAGTTNLARFRFRSNPAATELVMHVIMSTERSFGGTGGGLSADPRVELDVTVSGGATSTIGPIYYGVDSNGSDDEPINMYPTIASGPIAVSTVYECNLKAIDHARVLGVSVWEYADQTVQQSTNYYNATAPASGVPIYDATRERLLVGLATQHAKCGGIAMHWGLYNGASRTRTSATLINLVDNSTTGAPTGATPGVVINSNYHNTMSRTTVPFEMAVYGSIAAGSGTVVLTDSGGTDRITCTVNSATPGWFVATGNLTAGSAKWDLRYNGDGANTINVSAVSLIENE